MQEHNEGFTEDGVSAGQYTLMIKDSGDAEVLFRDATGVIKSATSEGANVLLSPAGDQGMNWILVYPNGTIEVYSLSFLSMKALSYRNTVSSADLAKNSLLVSDCEIR